MSFYQTDLTKAIQTKEQLQKGVVWVPPEGRPAKIRILPPWNARGLFFKEVKFHWNIGPDNKAFPCRTQYSQECFLCKALPIVAQKDPQLARNMQARPRYYLNILDVSNPDAGVQVYSCGKKSLTDILSYIADPSWGDITHPQTGRNVIIERSGTGRTSSFTIRVEGTATAIDMNVLNDLVDLDNMILVPSNEEMAKAFEAVAKDLKAGITAPATSIPNITSPQRAISNTGTASPKPPISFEAPAQREEEIEKQIRELLKA